LPKLIFKIKISEIINIKISASEEMKRGKPINGYFISGRMLEEGGWMFLKYIWKAPKN
jgi:hypothetical protein